MSKLLALFARDDDALRALADVEAEKLGIGQLVSADDGISLAVDSHLFLDAGEARYTVVGAIVGALMGVLLLYLHRVGLLSFSLLAPMFAGGAYPAYSAGGGIGAALGAFLCSLTAMSTKRVSVAPDPTLCIVVAPRHKLQNIRQTVEKSGGKVV